MTTKYRVSFDLSNYTNESAENIEFYLQDLLNKAVLPALNSDLVPLTLTVKKARK